MSDSLTPLNLPAAIRTQATRLLVAISTANSFSDLLRAADRAEGFALGIETVRALNPIDIENLYLVLENAAHERKEHLHE